VQLAHELLKATSESLGCNFIDVSPIYLLGNGEVNDGYFEADGVHLTLKGSKKLVQQLPVEVGCIDDAVRAKCAYKSDPPPKPSSKKPPQKAASSDNVSPRLFHGPGDILSNLAPCRLIAQEGKTFHSLEQLYIYRRARYTKADSYIPHIMAAKDAWAVMRIAKQMPVQERFEVIKYDIMMDCLQTKLEQSQAYRDELIATGDRPIIEDTGNKVWGRGHPVGYDGLNLLGKLHEIKRRDLISGHSSHTRRYKYCKVAQSSYASMAANPRADKRPPTNMRPNQSPYPYNANTQQRDYYTSYSKAQNQPSAGQPMQGQSWVNNNRFAPLASAEWPPISNMSNQNDHYEDAYDYSNYDDVFYNGY